LATFESIFDGAYRILSIVLELIDFDQLSERCTTHKIDDWKSFQLRLTAERISLIEGFEELICLPTLRGVERLPYQERTALHVMRRLRGRAILGDEVGLGKTIEGCLILKEYLMRGLVKRVLVLCSSSLVSQWQGELNEKFCLPFVTSYDPEFREAPETCWRRFDRVVASLPYARREAQRKEIVEAGGFDLVLVDESHILKKRTSSAWKLVSEIPKKFLLLLTATPVQNDLEELYNLITLLKPGQLGTPTQFKTRFVAPGDKRSPKNVQALRELMLDVMVRNTRSSVQINLPPRRARTVRLEAQGLEKELMETLHLAIHQASANGSLSRRTLITLQQEIGSSPAALSATLMKANMPELATKAAELQLGAKAKCLLDILKKIQEPVLIFSRFRATIDALESLLIRHKYQVHTYHGGNPPIERERSLTRFADTGGVMLMSDVGSEGKNLQFCRHLINFDLPWNPLRIEQRVGRLHRLGQTRPVEIMDSDLDRSSSDLCRDRL
jgi:SNF2 family DNA or RNA helicase